MYILNESESKVVFVDDVVLNVIEGVGNEVKRVARIIVDGVGEDKDGVGRGC